MGQLFERFSKVDAAAHELRPYVQAAAYLIFVFSGLGRRAPAKVLLESMQQKAANLTEADIVVRGFVWLAESFYLYHLDPDAYGALSCAQHAVTAFAQAEDLRNLCIAQRFLGYTQARIGAFEASDQTLQDSFSLALRLKESYQLSLGELGWAGLLALNRRRMPEVLSIARKFLQKEQGLPPLFVGGSLGIQAMAALLQGRLADAEEDLRKAEQILGTIPPMRVIVLVTLAQCLLLQGRVREARPVAEQALQLVESCEGLGLGDSEVRTAVAQVRYEDGDQEGARAVLQGALERLALGAASIPEPEMRQHFLNLPLAHALAQRLAREWHLGTYLKADGMS
jgi:tetratricopeptide (TPR) repeat protein